MTTVHGRANSSNVQKVRWALAELGRPHDLVERGGPHGGLDDPEFRRLTPFGQVPVLEEDDGAAFAESNAILRHLGRAAPESGLWPADPATAAAADAVMDWSSLTLWAALRPPFVSVAREGMNRGDEALGRQVAALAGPLTVLERLLDRTGWLTGEGFGLADIPAAVYLTRLVWLVGRGALPPATGTWFDACAARPAWEGTVFVDG